MAFIRGIVHLVAPAWAWLREWMFYVLPALSNLILVLLGVVLSLPTLAEKIEKTPNYRKALGAVCLLAGLVGFWFDVGQRRSSDQTNRQLLRDTSNALRKSDDLIDKTGVLVSSTNQMVTNFTVLMPQVNTLNSQVVVLNKKLEAAKGNPQLIAVLQGQIDTVRAQSAALSKQMVIGMVPIICGQMSDRAMRYIMSTQIDDLRRETPEQQAEVRIVYERDMAAILADADYLRQQLLQGETLTPEDQAQAAIFKGALSGHFAGFNGMKAAVYLYNLSKRVSPPSH